MQSAEQVYTKEGVHSHLHKSLGISEKSAVLLTNTQPETCLLDPGLPNNLCQ